MTDDRGLSFGNKPRETTATEFANSRAYVIGINAYQNGIPQLHTAVADAARLGKLLKESHGYTVLTLPQNGAPTLATLRDLLHKKMLQEVGANDRVLFYFAGHGIALDGDDGPEGYLVPQDANREDRGSFLPMTELSDALAKLPCRHLLLILDCCFAGAFRWSSTRDLSELPPLIHRERYERYIQDPAWQVLTSAAYDQTALDVLSGSTIGERIETADHSPFAAALFRALAGDADLIPRGKDGQPGGDGVITAAELYLYLRECVETATVERSMRQTPGFWPLKKHDKGEYILLSPGHELNLPPAPELNYANNPYRGLQSFEEEHSQFFFGRKREIEELRTLVSSQPLTVVLGASGTGKSSVVKAGLLPRLRNGDGEDWQILPTIRPGKSPLATLASLTLPGEATDTDEASRLTQLWSDENAFAQRIQEWADAQPGVSRLLLTVDQFEELITLCWDKQERDRFIAQLASAVNDFPERFRLIMTIRSDFEPQFSECALESQWMPSRYVVPAMSTDDLREAIEGPASVRVLYFQPAELVDRLIDEVIQTPGAMPLLSFTLSELYVRYLERRGDDRCLTLADFEQLGGVAGSLRSRATELYAKLDGPHQATMQRIMLRMVSAQGGELARRRVPKSELEYPRDNERVAAILNRLSEARLVVEGKEVDGDPYVEPAHDALVRGWDKLLAWTRGEQEQLSLRQLLTPAANDWHSHQGGTWHANPRLTLLNRIRRSEESWLNQTETRFISRSVAKRRTIFAGASGFIFAAFIALSGVTYYALGQRDQAIREVARVFKTEGEKAQSEGHLQSAMHYYAASLDRREEVGERDRFCVARIGVLATQTPVLRAIVESPELSNRVEFGPNATRLLTFSGTDSRISSPKVRIWEARTGRMVAALKDGESERVKLARFSADGRLLLVLFQYENRMSLWDAESGNILRRFEGHTGSLNDAIFGPGGNTVVTSSNDGTARIWDVDTARQLRKLNAAGQSVEAVRFSPDGRLIAAACTDDVRIWDATSGKLLHAFGTSRGALALDFDKEGSQLLSSPFTSFINRGPDEHDYQSHLWDVESGTLLHTFSEVTDARFAAQQGRIYTQLATRTLGRAVEAEVELWSTDGAKVESVAKYKGDVDAFLNRYSPRLEDGVLRIVDREGRTSRPIVNVSLAKIDPNERFVLTDYTDNTARLWDARSGAMVTAFEGHSAGILDVEFDRSGEWIATVSADKTIRVWQYAPTGEKELIGHQGQVTEATFFADGERAFTSSWNAAWTVYEPRVDGTFRIWDLSTGRNVAVLEDIGGGGGANISEIAFDKTNDKVLIGYSYIRDGDGVSAVRIVDATNGRIIAVLDGHSLLAYSANKQLIFTRRWRDDATDIVAIEEDTGKERYAIRGSFPVDTPQHVAGDRIATIVEAPDAPEHYHLQIWDTTNGEPLQCVENLWVTPYMSVSIEDVLVHPNGRTIVVLGSDSVTSQIVDMVEAKVIGSLQIPSFQTDDGFIRGGALDASTFSTDGRFLITVGNATSIWNGSTGESLKELPGAYVDYSATANRLVTASDGQIHVWNSETWSPVCVVRGVSDQIRTARILRGGRYLITGSDRGAVDVWDIETGEHLTRLGTLDAPISVVAVDERDSKILAGAESGTQMVWPLMLERFPAQELSNWISAIGGTALVDGSDQIEGLAPEAWFARRDQVVTRLSELLKAEDTHDHVALADALLKLSPANENAINTLIAALDSDEQTKNARAAAALAMADTNSENFRRAVVARVEDGRIGDAITPMFSLLGPQALPIIEPLLFEQTDLGSHVRANLVVAMKPAGVAALDLLERAVVDADPLVRITAGNLLRDLGPEALPAIPAMTRSIGMDDRDARIAVSRSLGELGPIAIPALIRAVRESPEHFTRLNSIVLLGQLNRDAKDAIPLLVEVAVKEEDLRSRAVDAIAAIDSAEGSGHLFGGGDTYTGTDSLPILRDYLESMEIDTRLKTVEVLTLLSEHEGLGENPVVELVDLALADVDERVRDKAALAAVIAFEDAKPNPLALASFVKLLRHSDQEVRERASMSIWKIGPPLAPWTRDLLEAESAPANETSGTYAGHALREIGMAALPYLRKCLADESPKIRAGAASIIGSLGKDAVEAVPDLIIQLDDANEQVRFAAADTLVGIGTTSTKVLDVIEEIVKNSSEDWHRQWGVRLLRDLGPIDPERVSTVLNRALNHADPETRLNAAESLLAIDNSKEPAIQTLMDLLPLGINVSTSAAMRLAQLDGEKERVAPAIRRALGDLPEDADGNLTMYFVRALIECNVIDELIDGLNQDQLGTFTTGEGMEAIVKLLPTHLDRIPKVASLLSNKAEDVREQAAKILGSVGPAAMGALPALQLASSDSSDSVRSAALSAINQLRAQELLDADDEVTRLEAAENLLQRDLHSDRIVSVLSAIVSNSSDPNLRIRGVEGLGKVGDAQRAKAAQVMNECLKDEIAIVRFNAAKGLLKLNAHVNDAVAELNAVVLAGLEDDEYSYCSSAAELLADLGSPIPETVSSLQTAARKFPDYRSAFLEALGKLHAIEALVQLLDESENEDDVDEILNEIESALEEDSQAIEKLAPMLKHVNVTRRIQGIKTLGNLSADEEERRKALQHLLNDDEQEVRVAAAETLKRIDLENKSP